MKDGADKRFMERMAVIEEQINDGKLECSCETEDENEHFSDCRITKAVSKAMLDSGYTRDEMEKMLYGPDDEDD